MLNKFLNTLHAFQNPWNEEKPKTRKDGVDYETDIINDTIKKVFRNKGNFSDNKYNKLPKILSFLLFGIPILAWLSTGFYTVDIDQQGVVTRFGKYHRVSDPGLHYKLPDPVEIVEKVSVTRINKEFIGIKNADKTAAGASIFGNFNVSDSNKQQQDKSDISIPEESQMLTGDENIIDLHLFVQWLIKNPRDYLFNIRDDSGENTVRSGAESAIRQVIGTVKLYDALSEQRQDIEQKAKAILQQTLDSYNSGIEVTSLGILYSYVPAEVKDAYRDIQSAKADKEREINQAYSYRNDIIPKARGEAQSIIAESKSYKDSVILRATGESEKFNTIFTQYAKSKEVTRKRLYIETMEDVMQKSKKIIIDVNNKNLLQMMSLSDMMKKTP